MIRRISACLLALSVLASTAALAQNFPNKPLRWLVAYPAGGGSDLYTRTIGQHLASSVGQQVIVENRPGAAGIIGADAAAKSAPDGYTLFTGDIGTLMLNPLLYRKLPYDPHRDFQAVTLFTKNPLIFVVHPSVPAKNVNEFVAHAKANPGKLNYASVGAGTIFHLATEIFKRRTGTDMVHVPYKGSGPAIQDVLTGQVSMMFVDYATGAPHIKAGKLRAIAVTTKERIETLPEIPSIHESGVPDFDAYAWLGAVVPAGTPKDVVNTLSREIVAAMKAPDVRKRFIDSGSIPLSSTPEEFAQLIRSDAEKWGAIVKALGLTLD
jgi:tripartite-type tricarboxylate transporter receptor subunit TctC